MKRGTGGNEHDLIRLLLNPFQNIRLDLPADRRLGDEQLVGGVAEAGQARHRLEGPQRTHGERSVAQLIHARMVSIDRVHLIGRPLG